LTERASQASDPGTAAATWLARLRAHDVSDEDRAAFATWLAADARHRREFDQLTELWHALEGVARASALPPTLRAGRRSYRLPLAAAAAVLVTALAVFMRPWSETYRTEHGVLAMHVLDDGTRLHLNTESAVRVAFDQSARRIELESGELFVEVAPDRARPLTVGTRFGDAVATGTAFAVRDTADRVLVTVTEGHVRVRARDASTRDLEVGDQAELGPEALVTRRVDGEAVTSWRDGALVYDGVPLAKLIEDLNRYLPRRMTIADPELANQRVSAVLRLGDQEEMLEALAKTLPMRWTVVSDTLILLHAA
jgi:transmembrane sensor